MFAIGFVCFFVGIMLGIGFVCYFLEIMLGIGFACYLWKLCWVLGLSVCWLGDLCLALRLPVICGTYVGHWVCPFVGWATYVW